MIENKDGENKVNCPMCLSPEVEISLSTQSACYICLSCGLEGPLRLDHNTGAILLISPKEDWKPYRKKPINIVARIATYPEDILTKEGIMKADTGDYIVKGVDNELYPVKPSIFEKTYDPA